MFASPKEAAEKVPLGAERQARMPVPQHSINSLRAEWDRLPGLSRLFQQPPKPNCRRIGKCLLTEKWQFLSRKGQNDGRCVFGRPQQERAAPLVRERLPHHGG